MHKIRDKKFYLGPKFGTLFNKRWITISELLHHPAPTFLPLFLLFSFFSADDWDPLVSIFFPNCSLLEPTPSSLVNQNRRPAPSPFPPLDALQFPDTSSPFPLSSHPRLYRPIAGIPHRRSSLIITISAQIRARIRGIRHPEPPLLPLKSFPFPTASSHRLLLRVESQSAREPPPEHRRSPAACCCGSGTRETNTRTL
jgi:hypothetical protein